MNGIAIEREFRSFVEQPAFPCLAAKGLVRKRGYTLRVYGSIGSQSATSALAHDLGEFAESSDPHSESFAAFVAVFRGRPPRSEDAFETALWSQLQMLHDSADQSEWDPTVSSNPEDSKFGFSFAKRAFFVIGLHPGSSRMARRFSRAALVFNPHSQFEQLRQEGRFERLRTAIRERDLALQGEANSTLNDFGARSEAEQYSGKAAVPGWRCPFHHQAK